MSTGNGGGFLSDLAKKALLVGLNDRGWIGGGQFKIKHFAGLTFQLFECFLDESALAEMGSALYRDCFAVGEQTGFGFDRVELEDLTGKVSNVARVYAGGTVPKDKLAELGLGEKDVTEALKCFLTALGDRTRLDQTISIQNGKWIYVYDISEDASETFGSVFILAEESMYYFASDGSGIKEPVFTHYIILIEIK